MKPYTFIESFDWLWTARFRGVILISGYDMHDKCLAESDAGGPARMHWAGTIQINAQAIFIQALIDLYNS